MFKSILLTIDLTDPATWVKALPQAIEMAQWGGGVLHIVSVVPDMGTALVSSHFPEGFARDALNKAKQALDNLVENNVPEGLEVHAHLAYGDIHEKAVEAITRTGCDLVVMASPAPDRVREFLVGSNADRIVRRSPVSVLVVRS
ncbi:universal stress protein [Oceaniovalibus sp. ACAM 378]|jgi:nucleotide-binding universal stress UspA family protein|uniref:universal stress protein n=1 Tax=Oceaniovalibus sp. ACAM 378 TaxID=2599923 RepID=UPI0011D621ED|nr:universal stress protein [Oceaniovalibus sp. ACAM 378]TYB88056.1 universal stress protein [Oceaniovalibus sp. ACAM 378]